MSTTDGTQSTQPTYKDFLSTLKSWRGNGVKKKVVDLATESFTVDKYNAILKNVDLSTTEARTKMITRLLKDAEKKLNNPKGSKRSSKSTTGSTAPSDKQSAQSSTVSSGASTADTAAPSSVSTKKRTKSLSERDASLKGHKRQQPSKQMQTQTPTQMPTQTPSTPTQHPSTSLPMTLASTGIGRDTSICQASFDWNELLGGVKKVFEDNHGQPALTISTGSTPPATLAAMQSLSSILRTAGYSGSPRIELQNNTYNAFSIPQQSIPSAMPPPSGFGPPLGSNSFFGGGIDGGTTNFGTSFGGDPSFGSHSYGGSSFFPPPVSAY